MDLKGDPLEIPKVLDTGAEHGTGDPDDEERSFVSFWSFFLSGAQ